VILRYFNITFLITAADPDQAFEVGSQTRGRQKGLHLLIPKVVYNNRWVSHKSGYFLQAQKVSLFVGTMQFSGNNHSLNALISLIQITFEAGPKNGPRFSQAHINEITVGVQNNLFYLQNEFKR